MLATTTAPTDKDLASVQEARRLAQRAKQAAPALAEFSQAQIDRIIDAAAGAATPRAEEFARLAVEETTYGVVADKVEKNLFSSEQVYRFIRPMKTVGVVARDEARKLVEIAEPFGVVAAIVPSTNPTSTAIYKILISLKARCPIVISPHPAATRCITCVAEVMGEAAASAGAPAGAVNWMQTVTIEGTQELMKHRDVAVILATGGMGLVRAAYSAGKPAYGVGPGNVAVLVDSPGFNFRLGPALRRQGVRVLYYIAPQVWAWHPERARAMSRWVDRLAVVFPFEESVFREAGVDARFVGHPLLEKPVVNDVSLPEPRSALIVTGSNMSGKTTMLRAMGANTVLALCGAPVCAEFLRVSPLRIATSMRVKDSLERGVSYFYAEVQRIRDVLEAARSAQGKVLRATPAPDRISALFCS